MAKTRRKKTTKALSNRELWNKEQERLLKEITKLREQGYEVDTSKLPQIKKNVTQQKLKEIKAIKPKQLKKLAYTYNLEGEKIGYEQYQQWLEEQPQNQEYYPTIDIMDKIAERIEDRIDVAVLERIKAEIEFNINDPKIVRSKGVKGFISIPTTNRKNLLIEILEDSYLAYGDAYLQYLLDNETRISDEIDKINYIIYDKDLETSFANISRELKMGMSLSMEESQMVNNMNELEV